MSSVEAASFRNPGDLVRVHRSVIFSFQPGQDHLVGTVDAREHRVLSRIVRHGRLAAQVLIQAGVIEKDIVEALPASRSCFNGARAGWHRKTLGLDRKLEVDPVYRNVNLKPFCILG